MNGRPRGEAILSNDFAVKTFYYVSKDDPQCCWKVFEWVNQGWIGDVLVNRSLTACLISKLNFIGIVAGRHAIY